MVLTVVGSDPKERVGRTHPWDFTRSVVVFSWYNRANVVNKSGVCECEGIVHVPRSSVGANTVNGPLPCSASTRSAAFNAVTNV